MQMHRTSGQPDWVAVSPEKRNAWQRLAASSQGIITPGNFITVVGLVIVTYGLVRLGQGHYWIGFWAIALGRLCDVLDGWAAQATGTKSPMGEFLDVLVDKLTVLGVVIAFLVAHTLALWLLLAILTPHLIISVLTIAAMVTKRPLHPSRIGKYNMAFVWVVAAAIILIHATDRAHGGLFALVQVLALVNVATGLYVSYEYAHGRD